MGEILLSFKSISAAVNNSISNIRSIKIKGLYFDIISYLEQKLRRSWLLYQLADLQSKLVNSGVETNSVLHNELNMSSELCSDIQTFVLIFAESGRKRTHVYIGSTILTRFLHDHWGHCEIFVHIYLKSDRAYFKNTNKLQYFFYLVAEKHESEIT